MYLLNSKIYIDQLIKCHLKMQLEELNQLASTLLTTVCISCKEKEKFFDYLFKENQSKNEIINTLVGNLSGQNISKKDAICWCF